MTDQPRMNAIDHHPGDSAFYKRVRRYVSGRVRNYYAIAAPGFADLCRQELLGLGLDPGGLSADAGGVTFPGRLVDGQRANLYLRTATRILMRIDAFVATNERQLEKKTAQIPWDLLLPAGSLPDVKVSSRRSRLYHSHAITQILLGVIGPRLTGPSGATSVSISQTVFVRLVDDRITLSLDSSGDPLFKRGLKAGSARAPIRETLAAAILMTAGYDPRRPLVDPMCGAGTFSLEAAMMTKQMAPGMKRVFAFMGWPAFREGQWSYLKRAAQAALTSVARPLIAASDVDAEVCERLSGRIAGNGMTDAVRVAQKDFFQCEGTDYGSLPGLVTINPPYGIRIGSALQADEMFNAICRHLARRFKGWTVVLIAPRPGLAQQLPFPARCLPLVHGGLNLTLIVATMP